MSKALITGANGGFGALTVKTLLNQGHSVVATIRNADSKNKAAADELSVLGAKIVSIDVTDDENVKTGVAKAIELIDGLDVVINNAGITRDGLLMRMSEEHWDQVMETNLKSIFNLTKAVQRTMLKARSGSIINLSSVVGVKGNAGQSNYAASKAGIIGFTKSIALELGSRNIRCNAVAPGFIETEMTGALDEKVVQEWRDAIPLKRGGSPEDVANLVLFLASDMSAYITGQVINVDGGMLT